MAGNLRIYYSIFMSNIRLTKTYHYAEKFEKFKFYVHRTWSYINEALNKRTRNYFLDFMFDGIEKNKKNTLKIESTHDSQVLVKTYIKNRLQCQNYSWYVSETDHNMFLLSQCVEATDVLNIILTCPKTSLLTHQKTQEHQTSGVYPWFHSMSGN